MHIKNFSNQNSLMNRFLEEMRSIKLQNDSMRFRRNIERIGEILAYEMSKELIYTEKVIHTPLGEKTIGSMEDNVVVCSILRAGLPMHNGILNYFDHAENCFISAYRHHPDNKDEFEIVVEYLAAPSLEGKTLIIADPMLASGQSMVAVYQALMKLGKPKEIHLMSIIGAEAGLAFVEKEFPQDTKLWIASVDAELNGRGYIIPGLGDAGDLAFGPKIDF